MLKTHKRKCKEIHDVEKDMNIKKYMMLKTHKHKCKEIHNVNKRHNNEISFWLT